MTEQNKDSSPLSYSPSPKPRKSGIIPIVITIVCGVLLAFGSCFGFVATVDTNSGNNKLLNMLSGWGMIAGVIVFVGGIIWGMVAIVVHLFRSRPEGL